MSRTTPSRTRTLGCSLSCTVDICAPPLVLLGDLISGLLGEHMHRVGVSAAARATSGWNVALHLHLHQPAHVPVQNHCSTSSWWSPDCTPCVHCSQAKKEAQEGKLSWASGRALHPASLSAIVLVSASVGYWTTWFSNCQPQADQSQVSGNGWPGAGTLHSGIGRKRSAPRSPRRGWPYKARAGASGHDTATARE